MAESLPKSTIKNQGRRAPEESQPLDQWQQFVARATGAKFEPLGIPKRRPVIATAQQLGWRLLRNLDPAQDNDRPLPPGIKTTDWNRPLAPEQEDLFNHARRQLRRRLGATILALTIGAGAFIIKEQVDDYQPGDAYSVEQRRPADNEVCASRQVHQKALLRVAAEFTNDLSARRAGAARIKNAIGDDPAQSFAVCYNPETQLTRVLTTEAIDGLDNDHLVNWDDFPGRVDQGDNQPNQ